MSTRDEEALKAHRAHRGKLRTEPVASLTPGNLPLFYTPGVGAVATHLSEHPTELRSHALQGNLVAVVSDGSAVLGLGNIGPQGAYPVMEGKAMLFKALAGVDAIPIVLGTQDPDEMIAAIVAIAPSFSGINLEDIAAPKCYQIEQALIERLSIPVMHDDQHATAVVVLAGLINACRVTGRELKEAKVVVVGAGAAGGAVARLLVAYGARNVLMVDSKGMVYAGRPGMDGAKAALAALTNPEKRQGDLAAALQGADAVVGLAQAGLLLPVHVASMAKDPIVFALSNPDPEILPDVAKKAGAAVVATGRSDFPNQINNVLVFPGVFRGALDGGLRRITTDMKLAAALAISRLQDTATHDAIVPSVFDERVVPAVAEAVKAAGSPSST